MKTDTIAAIATGLSAGGISIIRISGADAFSIASKLFVVRDKQSESDDAKQQAGGGESKQTEGGNAEQAKDRYKSVDVGAYESHTLHYGFVWDGKDVLDEVMLAVMKAPRTFTREDVVEIDCHGGIVVTKKLLSLVLAAGARLAEPGEFTKRAFLNGRIDLSQAEAVSNIIEAKNELFLKHSVRQLRGNVKEGIVRLRATMLREIAQIEAALDDPEHLSLDGFREELEENTNAHVKELEQMLATVERGRLMKEGIRTVILGKPNAGKSSLLNALIGEERAIVTDVAGTTRDTITEEIRLSGITLMIVDTAGIRDTSDVVERIGVELAHKEARNADLILYVADASVPLDENDYQILNTYAGGRMLALLNKTDLAPVTTEADLAEVLDRCGCEAQVLSLSAKEYKGFDVLEDRIKELFFAGRLEADDEIVITSERQKQDLLEAKTSLEEVLRSISMDMPEDFYTIDLTNAYEALGRIVGERMDEDVVNMIFQEFCLGK